MKIVDKTPYRSEAGEIDLLGRLQGTLKYGLTWYNRIQAQDVVIAIMEKQLGSSYALLRNITLPNTEINLPLILIGPPGVFLVNVTHETGVYRAKDDEWGTIAGDRFVPARINQISRTLSFGRVLQVYLDRQGFKGMFAVDSILMASDPGMHIESTRPAVRIVMSDALERFAASLNQGRVVLNAPTANDIVQALLVGRPQKAAPEPQSAGQAAPAGAPQAEGSAFETYNPEPARQGGEAFSADPLGFTFDEGAADQAAPASDSQTTQGVEWMETPAGPQAETAQGAARPRAARPKAKKRSQGPSRNQWIILAVMILGWLCIMVVFAAYLLFFANA